MTSSDPTKSVPNSNKEILTPNFDIQDDLEILGKNHLEKLVNFVQKKAKRNGPLTKHKIFYLN